MARFLLFALFSTLTFVHGLDIAASGPSSVAYIAESKYDARVYSAVALDDVVLFSYSTNGRNYYSTYSLNEDGAPFRLVSADTYGKEGVSNSIPIGDHTVLSSWFTQGSQQHVDVVSVRPNSIETRSSQSINVAAPLTAPSVGAGAGMIFYATNAEIGETAQARCIEVSENYDVELSDAIYNFPTSDDVFNVQVFPVSSTDAVLSYWNGRMTMVTFAHREEDVCGISYSPVIAFGAYGFSAAVAGENVVLCSSVKCLLCDLEGSCENLDSGASVISTSVSVSDFNDTHVVRARCTSDAGHVITVDVISAYDLNVVSSFQIQEDCVCTQVTVVRLGSSVFYLSYRRNDTGELITRIVRVKEARVQPTAEEEADAINAASSDSDFLTRKNIVIGSVVGVAGALVIAALVVAALLIRNKRNSLINESSRDLHTTLESPKERMLVEHDTITFAESIEDQSARSSRASSRAPSVEEITPVVLQEEEQSAPPSPIMNHSTLTIPYASLLPQSKIGQGSLGEVLRARYRDLSYAEVAMKMIETSNTKKIYKQQLDEFSSEAEVMVQLPPHPNVVGFHGMTASPDPFCVVFEYCEQSLWNKLRDRSVRFSEEDNLNLAKEIAKGMLHLHTSARPDPTIDRQRPVIHRDLTTRNIMIKDGLPAVSDYALAIVREGTAAAGNTSSDGPMKWVAPEVMLRKEYSVKSDAFSYGVVLYEIVTREAPWPGVDAVNAAMAVVRGIRMEIPENCHPVLANVMEQCWLSNPADRPDFEQILTMLEEEITTGPESEFDSE